MHRYFISVPFQMISNENANGQDPQFLRYLTTYRREYSRRLLLMINKRGDIYANPAAENLRRDKNYLLF